MFAFAVLILRSLIRNLGFVGPFIVKAKILLQELWSRGYDWDDTTQDEIADEFTLALPSVALLSFRVYPPRVRVSCVLPRETTGEESGFRLL